MDLKQLQAIGAIVPSKVFTRDIKITRPILKPQEEWADPDIEEHTGEFAEETISVCLRKLSSVDAIEVMQATKREQPFVGIYRGVCNPDGSPFFESIEQATQLKLWLAMPLFEAISEVAGNSPKASARRTSSGVRSRLRSAAGASANGNTSSTSTRKTRGDSTETSAAPSVT